MILDHACALGNDFIVTGCKNQIINSILCVYISSVEVVQIDVVYLCKLIMD